MKILKKIFLLTVSFFIIGASPIIFLPIINFVKEILYWLFSREFIVEAGLTSVIISFSTTYYFNRNTEIFDINLALYDKRKRVFDFLHEIFTYKPSDDHTNKPVKSIIDETNLLIEIKNMGRECEKIFHPELYLNIRKTLFDIKSAYDERTPAFQTSEFDTDYINTKKSLYDNEDASQFYWDNIYPNEEILNQDKMSSLKFFILNYKLRPLIKGYERKVIYQDMLNLVSLYTNMYKESISSKKIHERWNLGNCKNGIRHYFGSNGIVIFIELEEKIKSNPNGIDDTKDYFHSIFKKKIYQIFKEKSTYYYFKNYKSELDKIFEA